MQKRHLGRSGLEVSCLGLGCMGMSEFYGPADEAESMATLERALELGVTLFDTADMYGRGRNEELVGRFLKGRRDRVVLATKFGIVRDADGGPGRSICNRPDYVREACDASLKRLGVDTIDLYYAHRIDPKAPIEETVGAMAGLVRAGKVRALGLSEVSAVTLRRAAAVHPIAAVQSEYSLWERGPERAVLPACRELGIAFVPYSPLGRGFLSGQVTSTETLAADDFRRVNPRFQGANLDANQALAEAVRRLAATIGCTAAQLALGWLLAQGEDIIPIPGTKRRRWLEENCAAATLTLSDHELSLLDAAFPPGAATGARYPEAAMNTLEV
ncbi:MAG: aldo/keto reductase [Azospirillum sp.]|nr:aldo/keto reductase [Azospirillum sp.]